MALQAEHKRQIAQFLLIIDHYIGASARAATSGSMFSLMKAEFYHPKTILPEFLELTIVSAHMSSAAIRLNTIEEVLKEAGHIRPVYRDARKYYGGSPAMATGDPRGTTCSQWLHVMLRDNAGHEEPVAPVVAGDFRRERWRERQDLLLTLRFNQVYEKLNEIATEMKEWLRRKHRFEVKFSVRAPVT